MSTLPLGLRNRNPLNIRYDKNNPWVGQLDPEKGFCKFTNIVYGYRAAMKIMKNYSKKCPKGQAKTLRQIIEKWAPPQDHNYTERYIMYVCNYAHVPDYQKLWFNHTAEDKAIVTRVVVGMAIVENGVKWKGMIRAGDIEQAYDMVN